MGYPGQHKNSLKFLNHPPMAPLLRNPVIFKQSSALFRRQSPNMHQHL